MFVFAEAVPSQAMAWDSIMECLAIAEDSFVEDFEAESYRGGGTRERHLTKVPGNEFHCGYAPRSYGPRGRNARRHHAGAPSIRHAHA